MNTILLDRRQFTASVAALLAAPTPSVGLVVGQREGAAAGLDVLRDGGNAVDAVVAAALVAGVVQVAGCGIAGYGGHMVLAPARGKVTAIDFNSAAPAAARPDMFPLDERGGVKGRIDTYGWLAAGVPGTLAGLQLALDRFGTRKFAALVKPAIRHAKDGFPLPRGAARTIAAARERLGGDPGSRKLFFDKDRPLPEGATFRNPDLAALLEELAAHGSVEPFYKGAIARKIAAGFARNKGLVTEKDLAAYQAREVAPYSWECNGWTIHTAPLTAGGLTILQVMKALDALGWRGWERGEARVAHAQLEAMRLAWHDRLRLLGDPEKARVPVERLLSDDHARRSAERVRKALADRKPLAAETDGRTADGTIHLCAVDAAGGMASLTLTHGGSFGAQVTLDGLGLILGHGMSRFDPHPSHPNAPGPGKRPLHNMCPTIAYRDGRPALAVGGRGGRKIPNSVLQVLLGRVAEGRTLREAVAAPRLHTEGDLQVIHEAKQPASDVKAMKEIGFTPRTGAMAVVDAIERDPRSGELVTATR